MDCLDKFEKRVIIALVAFAVAVMGSSIYTYWHTATHHDYGMETVRTGDVTWVCLTDRGTTIGCDTVEEYQ